MLQACVDLLAGRDVDPALVRVLGGPHADRYLDDPVHAYWLRVWGARGLLWNWDPSAVPAVQAALTDEAWRVREMGAKVVARHLVGEALPALGELVHDPVPRVRAAASRALRRLTDAHA